MQHGTAREAVVDILDNVEAVLEGLQKRQGLPIGDVLQQLRVARGIVSVEEQLDERGVYGPDYGAGQAIGVSGVSARTVGRIDE